MTAMNGDHGGLTCDLNVTPMIDVLLVLLISFVVIVPAIPRGETAMAPHPSLSSSTFDGAVVLEVLKDADSAQRALLVNGDDQWSFTQIAEVIDIGHSAGADQIGLMTPKVLAGR